MLNNEQRALFVLVLFHFLRQDAAEVNLSVLPKPSTEPFGRRLAFSQQSSSSTSLTITWSTTAPLIGRACITLEQQHQHQDQVLLSRPLITSRRLLTTNRTTTTTTRTLICGTSRPFIEPSTGIVAHHIHTVTLTNLYSNAHYSYRCGNNEGDGWSSPIIFKTPPSPGSGSGSEQTNLLIVGDLGVGSHALTLPNLIKDALSGEFSALIHAGDIAYDLGSLQGRNGMHFLRQMEPISSIMPYMVAPGNHEASAFNFSHYKALYRMPHWEDTENLFYSFDVGLVHVLVYNTEVFFWPQCFGGPEMEVMHRWMKKDLEVANLNRAKVPWILVVGHRPMYCAVTSFYYNNPLKGLLLKNSAGHCSYEEFASRHGWPSECPHNKPLACRPASTNTTFTNTTTTSTSVHSKQKWPIEQLFHDLHVDIAVFGHIHAYARHFPISTDYNYQPYPPNATSVYVNPERGRTVHVTSGAGGNIGMAVASKGLPSKGACDIDAPWCVFQSGTSPGPERRYDFAHSRVFVHNASHLQWQQFSTTFDEVIDEWWVVRE